MSQYKLGDFHPIRFDSIGIRTYAAYPGSGLNPMLVYPKSLAENTGFILILDNIRNNDDGCLCE